MTSSPLLLERDRNHLNKLVSVMKSKADDPTYLVLEAHLLAEETLYRFIESQTYRPKFLSDARIGFPQLIALSRSFHRYSKEDWWGWTALKS